jgi:hypothetical protein
MNVTPSGTVEARPTATNGAARSNVELHSPYRGINIFHRSGFRKMTDSGRLRMVCVRIDNDLDFGVRQIGAKRLGERFRR